MYIRWKRKHRKAHDGVVGNITFCAFLVQSHRDGGKVKQKVIKYLGSIRREQINYPHYRYLFLHRVNQKLLALKIPESSLHSILARVREVVPEPEDTIHFSERGSVLRESLRGVTRKPINKFSNH